MRKYRQWFVPALLAAIGTVAAQTPIREERAASPDGIVEIHNLAGSVRVMGWSDSRVEVTGTLGKTDHPMSFAPAAKIWS